jgi:hypothetical protein
MSPDAGQKIRRPAVINPAALLLEFIPVMPHGAEDQYFFPGVGRSFVQKQAVFNQQHPDIFPGCSIRGFL